MTLNNLICKVSTHLKKQVRFCLQKPKSNENGRLHATDGEPFRLFVLICFGGNYYNIVNFGKKT